MSDRLRILMVLESLFPSGQGGAEGQVATLGAHFARLGHRVTVVVPKLSVGSPRTTSRLGRIAIARIAYPIRRGLGSLVLLAKLAALLVARRRKYDVVHAHIAHRMAAVCCVVAPLVGKRVVVKVSGWWEIEKGVLRERGTLADRVARACLRRAHAFQCISRRIADSLVAIGIPAERVHLVPNAVDTARFAARPRVARTSRMRTAVFVGRLVPEKNLGTLFRAFALAGALPLRLQLVGEGKLREQLESQAATLGYRDRIEFLGRSDRVEDALARADFGVLPSLIEGLSNTLLESMAAGLPVIASRVSGSEDFVRHGENGWLFDPLDAQRLAALLREAATMPRETLAAMGERARADVRAQAGLESVAQRLLALYAPGRAVRGGESAAPITIAEAVAANVTRLDPPAVERIPGTPVPLAAASQAARH